MDMPYERRAAVLEAEARRLAHVVARYGVLTRHQLAELSGARHWARGRFLRALELAEERGLIRDLGCSLYAPTSAVPPPVWHLASNDADATRTASHDAETTPAQPQRTTGPVLP